MTTTDPVEIKINIAGGVDQALDLLELGKKPTSRSIWFVEDTTPGLRSPFPLFQAGVILRVRQEESGVGDLTVKLRPCRRSQLTASWRQADKGHGWEYSVEADWSGSRRALAASCQAELSAAEIKKVISGGTQLSSIMHRRQEAFLTECADIRIEPQGLTALRPVAVKRWSKVKLDDHLVVVERWTVDDLDFVELSIRVGTEPGDGDPEDHQLAFAASVRARGLQISDDPKSKTQILLAKLSGSPGG